MISTLLISLLLFAETDAGFGPPPGTDLRHALFGAPCDCKGGIITAMPTAFTRAIDCGNKIAYLQYHHTGTGISRQSYQCVRKVKIIPQNNGIPGPCPSDCVYLQALHSLCYTSTQQCTGKSGTYLTSRQQRAYGGSTGGDWGPIQISGPTNKYAQASCDKINIGKNVCWSLHAPIHVSDGGGPTDQIREMEVKERVDEIIRAMYPPLQYHPLALPRGRGVDLDVQTYDILASTHKALNITNPDLAKDCWLCMTLGTPMPLALLTHDLSFATNCALSPPFRVQPMRPLSAPCIEAPFRNSSYDLNVGHASFALCTSNHTFNYTVERTPHLLCPTPGRAFVCGGNMAFLALPSNWTGLCVQASILPDINIISGDQPVPLPSIDYIAGRPKRAVAFIPLLVGLGVAGAMTTGSAGLGVAIHSYAKLSNQLINDVQTLSGTIHDLQDQIDSLAEVVLQNRRGLDLLTAEQGGICLALQEKCCFYANKSGMVRDKIKKLQEELVQRRKELLNNPLWNGLHGLLPYLLPLLGPLVGLLLLLSFGPWVFNRLTTFVKSQVDSAIARKSHIFYSRLQEQDTTEQQEERLQFTEDLLKEPWHRRWKTNLYALCYKANQPLPLFARPASP
uniref:Envelope protein n=1 Tax=Trichosurus vulpecula TaxID=9337 RepID=Q9GLF7_TRIVU|nr:envelope protein [Trichosurus vulpecula]